MAAIIDFYKSLTDDDLKSMGKSYQERMREHFAEINKREVPKLLTEMKKLGLKIPYTITEVKNVLQLQ